MPNVSVNLGQCCGIGCEISDAHQRAEVMFTLFDGANAASLPYWAIGCVCTACAQRVTQRLGLNQRVTRRLAAGLQSSAPRASRSLSNCRHWNRGCDFYRRSNSFDLLTRVELRKTATSSGEMIPHAIPLIFFVFFEQEWVTYLVLVETCFFSTHISASSENTAMQ